MSEGQQSQAERPETAAVLDPDMGLDGLDGLDDAGWPWQADMISAGFWFEDGFLNHHLPDQLPVLLTPGAGNRNPATVPNQESRQEAFFLLNLDQHEAPSYFSARPTDSSPIQSQPERMGTPSGPRSAGSESGVAPTRNRPYKKRRKFNETTRQKVKRVRDQGACIRCKVYHESCDDSDQCGRCRAVEFSASIFTQPCYRESLDNIIVFRAGNSRANQLRSQLPRLLWAADDQVTRTVHVQYPFVTSRGNIPTLALACRKFVPRKTDVLKDVWVCESGVELVLEFPPFACYDTNLAAKRVEKYIEECELQFEQDIQSETTDALSSLTILEAIRFASLHPDSSVKDALKIRQAAYFCRESMTIVSEETLGIRKVDDKRFSIHDQTPVPSLLDFQIDTIAIHYMSRIMKHVIKRLKRAIFGKRNKEHWYEVYLTCFVLLSTLTTVYSLQLSYMGWNQNMAGDTYANVSYITKTMIEEWEYSANNLIAHFRCVLRGMIPFSLVWDRPLEEIEEATTSGLDESAIRYMQNATELLPGWLQQRDELRKSAPVQIHKHLGWLAEIYRMDAIS